jgi:glycosyltransferase involved in cell wall biosynthesis
VSDGIDGFVTRALDVGDFARVLRLLCKDGKLREKMGAAARKGIENRNWNNAFRQFWNETL